MLLVCKIELPCSRVFVSLLELVWWTWYYMLLWDALDLAFICSLSDLQVPSFLWLGLAITCALFATLYLQLYMSTSPTCKEKSTRPGKSGSLLLPCSTCFQVPMKDFASSLALLCAVEDLPVTVFLSLFCCFFSTWFCLVLLSLGVTVHLNFCLCLMFCLGVATLASSMAAHRKGFGSCGFFHILFYPQIFASLETVAPILAQCLLCLVSLLGNGLNFKIPTDSK